MSDDLRKALDGLEQDGLLTVPVWRDRYRIVESAARSWLNLLSDENVEKAAKAMREPPVDLITGEESFEYVMARAALLAVYERET